MEMFRKHTSPLLVIIAGLLSCIATIDAQNLRTYTLCDSSLDGVMGVTPSSDPFIIQSSYYRFANYSNNLDCTLVITSGAEPIVLSFEYRVFNLELTQNCVYDYLCVVGVKFCGNWATGRMFQLILPSLRTSTVHFHTDSSLTGNGFYIIVTPQPVLPVHQIEGSGWSTEYITYVPTTYYPGMPYTDGCSQSLIVPSYGLNTTADYTGNVTYEQTTITAQNTTTSTEEIPADDTTIAPTNSSIYTLCESSTPAVLSVTPSSEPFIIQSPNYPNGYANNLDCTLTIASGLDPMVLSFEYRVLNLEIARDCVFDYLCVVGVKFCGNWSTERIFKRILPPLSNSTVHFHTDSSVTLNGFYIIVTSQPVLPIQQVQGSGWSERNITYVPATYYPGMQYTDGCSRSLLVPSYGQNYTDAYTENVTNERTSVTTQRTTTITEEISAENTTIAATNLRMYTLCESSTPGVLRVTSTSEPFIIRSSNYPYRYANNLDCTLTIESGVEPVVLSFEYRVLNLELARGCVFDYLCVVGVKFCGNWSTERIFKRILPPLSNSTVHFHTDSSVTLNGFYVSVTPQLVLPIQQVQGSGWSERTITYVPASYYPGMPYTDRCSRSLLVPNYGLNTTADYTGNVTYEQTTITAQNITTSTEEIPAEDTTIAHTHQDNYYFCNSQQSNNYIDINSGSSPFLIRSPNYGGAPYGNNLNCSLVIRSGAEPLVLSLRIRAFQLESQTTCNFDYLCVHGTKFCGSWLNGYTFNYILPENSRFTAVFKTDGSVTFRGFEIAISQELARSNQTVRQPLGEYASRNTTLSYTRETYRPGYPYSDRCVAASRVVPTTSGSWFPE